MSEIQNEPSAEFVKGFNESYWIAQQNPELAAQLAKGISGNSERLEGFKKGYDQYVLEYEQQYTLPWLKEKEPDEQPDKEINRDDIDLEIEPE